MYSKGESMDNAFVKRGGSMQKETVEEIRQYQIMAIPERGIVFETARAYGVRTALSETDGVTPIAHYFGYTDEKGELCGYKKRDLTKNKKEKGHFTVIGRVDAQCQLFGTKTSKQSGGKRVVITEGEYDAMVCWQSIKENALSKEKPSVVSIGLGTANAVMHIGSKKNLSWLKKHSQIVLAFDNDSADANEKAKGIRKGKEATSEVYGLIPEAMVAVLPEDSDPCEMFMEEGSTELFWAIQKPIQFTPEGFVMLEDIREEAIALPVLGVATPWEPLTRLTLGFRKGEGFYWGAGTKMGKSVVLDCLVQHELKGKFYPDGTPKKAALFKFEEQPAETLKKVAGKFWHRNFSSPERVLFVDEEGREHDVWGEDIPDEIREYFYTQQELTEAVDSAGQHLILYNNYGRCSWAELKGAIRHAVLVEHVETIYIDPITRLTAGMTASDANQELEAFADEISKMAKDLGFVYHCFCHLKSPEMGKPHEFGGKVMSAQFRGSRAMQQACYYMVGLQGNKDPSNCERLRNTRQLVLLEDRKYGQVGIVHLFYDKYTGDLVVPPAGFLDQENNDDTIQTLPEWRSAYPTDEAFHKTYQEM